MTIKARESLVLFFFIVAAAALAGFGLGAWLLGIRKLEQAAESISSGQGSAGFATAVASAAACGAFAATALGILVFRAGKSVSVEIFFFSAWAFSLSLELARGLTPWLVVTGSGFDAFGFVTRIVLFGRYLGITGLFLGSLYAAGFQQERVEYSLGAVFLTSIFFASIHPLDLSVISPGLIVKLGYGGLVRSFEGLLIGATATNYLIAWRDRKDKAFLAAGGGALTCSLSAIILRGAPPVWLAALAFPALALGAWLHIKSLYRHYLWR